MGGSNMVVAAPTASGKTLIAEIAMLKGVLTGKKALYIVPLKALASEKYNEFKEKYEKLGLRIAMSVGDRDSSDSWLAGFDIIIVTSEKLDSLIRHNAPWIDSVGLVIADEIHLIDSPDRGPTLEVILTRLRQLINPQILALSATISNHKELADWLGAKAVKSDFRPVKLYNGLFLQGKISWSPKKPDLKLGADMPPVFEITKDTIEKGKQSLVFVSTRRRAESLAEKLGDILNPSIKPDEKKELVKLSHTLSHILEHPTKQCDRIARCLQKGAVFHHAGLVPKQRKLIEDNFRSGLIKVICSTPTLAAGVNLPAFRVVVRDVKRFTSFRGMDYIPVLEVQQMMGRAGRPAYDTEGQSILIANSADEGKKLWNQYIHGEPEKIVSKLGVEPVLRMHVLSLIATGSGATKQSLLDFFSNTFYAFQYKDLGALTREIDNVLELLKGYGFIEYGGPEKDGLGDFRSASSLSSKDDEDITPTIIGKRVAELYIDPLTANHIIESLGKMDVEKKTSGISILHVVSNCLEMRPGLNIRKKDMERDDGSDSLQDFMMAYNDRLIGEIPHEWDIEYDGFIRSMKLTWMFSEWMDEAGEDALLEQFGVTPGELRARLDKSDWLFYSMQEIGMLLELQDVVRHVRKARLRVKYGIKEELLPLIKLKNIGRVRARNLFGRGLRSPQSLRSAPVTSLAQILGPNIAKDVKRQLSGLESEKPTESQQSLR
jgi:helicase